MPTHVALVSVHSESASSAERILSDRLSDRTALPFTDFSITRTAARDTTHVGGIVALLAEVVTLLDKARCDGAAMAEHQHEHVRALCDVLQALSLRTPTTERAEGRDLVPRDQRHTPPAPGELVCTGNGDPAGMKAASVWLWRLGGGWVAEQASEIATWWEEASAEDLLERPAQWVRPIADVPERTSLQWTVARSDQPAEPLPADEAPAMLFVVFDLEQGEYLFGDMLDTAGSLDEARRFVTEDDASQAIERYFTADETAELTIRQLTSALQFDEVVDHLDGWTDDETHVAQVKASLDTGDGPFLLVEGSTRDSRFWVSLHESPEAAAVYSRDQEYSGGWYIAKIVDLRDGSEWEVAATYTSTRKD